MHKSTVFFLTGILFFLSACGPSREKSVKMIQGLEHSLFSQNAVGFDKSKADSLLTLYDSFITDHPKDSLRPGFIFKAANLAMNMNDGNKAITYFDQYTRDYPDGPKASLCLFFKAFIYENMLKDLEKAKEAYQQFIERYPDNDFTDDARLALQNLGKTPDQMVQEFEAKQKADSIASSQQVKGKPKKK